MITRRSLVKWLSGMLPVGLVAKVAPASPEAKDFYRSFDARVWARAFVAHVQRNQSIATDEETMTTWFANAIMRGYDEGVHAVPANQPISGDEARARYRGAVARGWCSDANSHKEMDSDLAEAIVDELMKGVDVEIL